MGSGPLKLPRVGMGCRSAAEAAGEGPCAPSRSMGQGRPWSLSAHVWAWALPLSGELRVLGDGNRGEEAAG